MFLILLNIYYYLKLTNMYLLYIYVHAYTILICVPLMLFGLLRYVLKCVLRFRPCLFYVDSDYYSLFL